MLTSVEGKYKNGKIELDELPKDIQTAKVIVTFVEVEKKNSGQMMTLGMFSGPIKTNEKDFKLAEWHGDPDDGLDWQGA